MEGLEIKIFLSSTFNDDMLPARDAFRNEMLAKLNAIAGQIQGNVYLNDFELGIPEGTPALSVVCTCLDAIMSSDYFIGILSDFRGTLLSDYLYGTEWCKCKYSSLIKEAIDREYTVLELEFLCAINSGVKSHFYIDYQNKIKNVDSPIEEYLFSCNQGIQGFSNLDELKKSVIDALESDWNLAYSLFASYSQEDKDTNMVLANKLRYYVPQPEYTQRISDYIQSKSTQVLWITGKEGCGKSTVLFDWYNMHLYDREYNVLYFDVEHIAYSLDDLLYLIVEEVGQIENRDYISELNSATNDLDRIECFKRILEKCEQPYIFLIDGLEHILSKAGVKSSYCLPDVLHSNIKIIATWGEKLSNNQLGENYCIDSFDVNAFAEMFFKREGKALIYEKYREQITKLLSTKWRPDASRMALSCLILSAKYNNIESIISDFSKEYERYNNPYCSYITWLNKYFSFDGNEPLKEALLLLYNSENGLPITILQTTVHGGTRIKDIFNIIYFLVRKNTNNRYLLGNSQLKFAIELLYRDELSTYATILSNINQKEIVSKNLEDTFDAWTEYLDYLYCNGKKDELKNVFSENLGKIANLWYYKRNLLISVFELVKDEKYIEIIKDKAIKDTDSNAPFFISHLLYICGYYEAAKDIYSHILSNISKYNLSDMQYATILNNMGLFLFENNGDMAQSEKYLLEGYNLRKRHFVENKKDYFESCDNLFIFYFRCNKKDSAKTYLQEEIQLGENCFRENSIENYKCYISRAWWQGNDNPEQAIYYYDKALKICDVIYEPDNLASAKVLQMKAELFLEMEKYREAKECGLKADSIYDRIGILNDDRARTCYYIARATLGMEEEMSTPEEDNDSRAWFKKTLSLLKTISSEEYNNLREAVNIAFPDTDNDYWKYAAE